MANEDNKVERWEEEKLLKRVEEQAKAMEGKSSTAIVTMMEQDQIITLIDNQTQMMKLMDRDRKHIEVLESRIKELQGQVLSSSKDTKQQLFTNKEQMQIGVASYET